MSKKYRVIWARVAQNDLHQILEYIAKDSPDNALQILTKIRRKASGLCAMPDRGRIVPELKEQGIGTYRELIVAPWRIIYRISDKTVFVLSVIDSRRNVEDILLDRFVMSGQRKM
ncbi:MAG: type II toxin-antitoxin system RelE/ParE family toxin [Syntrophaceae bacterium]|nr:type II toxin-antitoxin system RelE/ParE family toxin [Syntrophaceae bacterium]